MHGSNLFRANAFEAQKQGKQGKVLLLPSQHLMTVSMLIFSWVIASIVFLMQNSFAEKLSVTGYLKAQEASIAIGPKEATGTIIERHVENGAYVQKGQALVSIKRPLSIMLGEKANAEQRGTLDTQIQLLKKSNAQELIFFNQQLAYIKEQQAVSTQRQNGLNQQAQVLKQRIGLSKQQVQQQTKLYSKRLISGEQLMQAQQNLLAQQQQMAQLDTQLADELARHSQLRADLSRLLQQKQQRETQVKLNQLPIEQEINQLSAQASYTLFAPRDGIVNNLHVQVGDDVSRFPVLLKISPVDTKFSAVLAVPASAAGFVEKGQHIALRLDAFAYQKYGSVSATVEQISTTVTLPNESLSHPIAVSQAVFMVEAELAHNHIFAKGEHILFKEGMTLKGDVTLSERSLMQWLFSPLYSIKGSF